MSITNCMKARARLEKASRGVVNAMALMIVIAVIAMAGEVDCVTGRIAFAVMVGSYLTCCCGLVIARCGAVKRQREICNGL